MEKVIISGKIINYNEDIFYGFIEVDIKTGLIKNVYKEYDGKIDYQFDSNCVIFPGMGDIHIHAREDQTAKQNYKEDYSTVGNAALNGGLVYVCAMPNTTKPLTREDDLKWHRNRINELCHPVKILNYIGVGLDTKPFLDEYGKKLPYKLYMGPSVGDLFLKSKEEIDNVLSRYKRENVSFHVEDFKVLEQSIKGKIHSDRRPAACVEEALEYLLPMIEKYEINAKLCHWSTGKKSLDMIFEHKKRMEKKDLGFNTTVEISPEHLIFDTDILKEKPELWPYIQMNPSIRSEKDRFELISALKDGLIDYLATDHAPHTLDEKFKNFSDYSNQYPGLSTEDIYKEILLEDKEKCIEICYKNGVSGVPWLDTYALVISYLVEKHDFSYQDIVRIAAYNPGYFVNDFLGKAYGKGFGRIEDGYMGSFTVINFDKPIVLKREMLKTKVGWSPLEGMRFAGQLEAVFIRGQLLKEPF